MCLIIVMIPVLNGLFVYIIKWVLVT